MMLTISIDNPVTPQHLERLRAAAGAGPVLITTHTNPDPDALASGLALAHLLASKWGVVSKLVYNGKVGRAENRSVLRLLTPEWEYHDALTGIENYSAVALVDSQPGAGNNNLPTGQAPTLVFDHHQPLRPETSQAAYADIRSDIGATVTMMYQYLAAANVPVASRLATAMFYGLKTDTSGLTRNASLADATIYTLLHAALDKDRLTQVELSGISREYFEAFHDGLQNAWIVGQAITTYLGEIHRPDLVAEMADLLLRLEGIHTALCLGCYENTLYFSLRTGLTDADAGILIQEVIPANGRAGGHGTIAGGQIPLEGPGDPQQIEEFQARFLQVVGEGGERTPLLKNHPRPE